MSTYLLCDTALPTLKNDIIAGTEHRELYNRQILMSA